MKNINVVVVDVENFSFAVMETKMVSFACVSAKNKVIFSNEWVKPEELADRELSYFSLIFANGERVVFCSLFEKEELNVDLCGSFIRQCLYIIDGTGGLDPKVKKWIRRRAYGDDTADVEVRVY